MKDVVSVNVAKLAQRLGFDEPCHWFYLVNNEGEPEQFEWGWNVKIPPSNSLVHVK